MRHAVVIVGAGLAGVALAHALWRDGVDVRLLEARTRIGGRILGVDDFDLGPSWVWPTLQPRLAAWIAAHGLRTYAQHSVGALQFEAADGRIQTHASGMAQEPPSQRLLGGSAALLAPLPALQGAGLIETGVTVRALQLGADGVDVIARGADGPRRLQARHVVLTLPPRLIAALDFTPALPAATRARLTAIPTWMAGQAKVLVRYAQPFWRAAGFSGAAFSQRGPIGELHDASLPDGRAALTGFIAWPAPMRTAHADLPGAIVAQLQRLFGSAAAQPLAVHVQDWALEEFTATPADSAAAPREHPDDAPIVLPEPWRTRVLLAGSEVAPDFAGYLEGALQSAAAARIALR
ncbi:MAG: FAD-dependent oxidoreductase [Metallibacterium scheffleri]|jgi:monoamine oxidase|uniref:flavin monoamine oxidase family protein n=1 Tax=Metallibacterium scheffleri TaxID=993689 RepID=UPI0026EB714C|nr:FAD-dependent oxidoreductase [Metallibacterium scheffleri]MCK9368113.1 FAD-dependent oxidoreductase [Metallibacterium scheffleri]